MAGLKESKGNMLNGVARFFLRAKHWQVFLLLIGTQLAEFIGWIVIEITVGPSQSLWITTLINNALSLPFFFCLIAWWWSMGSLLYPVAKPARELNIGVFRFSSVVLLFSGFHVILFPSLLIPNPFLIAAIALMLLTFLFSLFYVPYFLSKSLVIKNRGHVALGGGDVKFFFLFLFYLIGVWMIQPRINQLYAEKMNAEPLWT